jgi:hydroxymethylpyrimidine/phosphomethylpyrimidine kinase
VPEREARDAAAALVAMGARAALVKGGHGSGAEAVDWLATRGEVVRIALPRRRTPPLHGTGCTLASLIAGRLAARPTRGAPRAEEIVEAVRWARAELDRAIASPLAVGRGLAVLRVGAAFPGPRRAGSGRSGG